MRPANFSVERMAAGGTHRQIWALVARRHRSPVRSLTRRIMRAQPSGFWVACVLAAMVSLAGNGANAAETLIVTEEIPLSCAISNLARQANLNYILDPRASSASIGPAKWMMPQTSVTRRWTNVAPELALQQLLMEHSLRMLSNAATPVIRILPLTQVAEPMPANRVEKDTNSVIPVVLLEYVPMRVVIDQLGKKAGLEISVDPELPIPTSGPPELTIGTSVVSVYWENIRPRQALFALLDACDLAISEHPGASSATVIAKKRGLGGRRQR